LNKYMPIIFKKISFKTLTRAFFVLAYVFILVGYPVFVSASDTSSFTQTINAGTLDVDIVDGSYVTVASPSVPMSASTFSFVCQTSTGTFGTVTEQIYVSNPDAADNGWTVSLAAAAPTTLWESAGTDFDFNDSGGLGCVDSGIDTDTYGGQMSVDPSVSTLASGQCATCTTNNITKGSSSAFEEGVTDSITILTGAASSDDIGDWTLVGVDVSQEIPAEQPAAGDYSISLTLSIVAS
jgi:hypothetical protein